jgi:hypothetical protein
MKTLIRSLLLLSLTAAPLAVAGSAAPAPTSAISAVSPAADSQSVSVQVTREETALFRTHVREHERPWTACGARWRGSATRRTRGSASRRRTCIRIGRRRCGLDAPSRPRPGRRTTRRRSRRCHASGTASCGLHPLHAPLRWKQPFSMAREPCWMQAPTGTRTGASRVDPR